MKASSIVAYRENRARISVEELRKLEGKWVAFSSDGSRIIASGASIVEVADHVRAAQEDLEEVVLERIERNDSEINLGGAELGRSRMLEVEPNASMPLTP